LASMVIVGFSAAGITAAETLRSEGYDGELTVIGAEQSLPYDRPPLSKKLLSGQWDAQRIMLRTAEQYEGLGLNLMLGRKAVKLDSQNRVLTLDNGQAIRYDGLIIATGVTPRLVPGATAESGVHVLRTLDDAQRLRGALERGSRAVILGGGLIGTEVAATARALGLEVTLVEARTTPLAQLGQPIGDRIADLHRRNGVDLRTGVKVNAFHASGGRTCAVDLSDGTRCEGDVFLLALGSNPATDWLAGSGLSLTNGIDCDAFCRAGPGIYAAGDVASWPHPRYGVRMRLEHRTNATEQAMTAARNLLGANEAYAPLPYFWSDQYDVKIQGYGTFPGDAQISIKPDEAGADRFIALYHTNDRLVGALAWNHPREIRQYAGILSQPQDPQRAASSEAQSL
jgi:3-phenylpropionate/trans-cinnamate dioxygenase ferredoxin reductase subunit